MGIRQLQTFIQKHVPNGYPQVSLTDECESFSRTHQERPIFLIDLLATGSQFLTSKEEILCGLRYNKIYELLENFFKKLTGIADLVFYTDGVLTDAKVPESMRRQEESFKTSQKIVKKVCQKFSVQEIIDSEDSLIYTMPAGIMEHLATKYGTFKTAVIKECDTEVAQFACRNPRVLAVFADDSDFLIFPGHWRYFSLRDLDIESLKTREYNRKALRDFLELTDQEMPLLGTFNGNDFISFDENLNFHKAITRQPRNPKKRFPAIAELIKSSKILQSKTLCKDVTYKIFRTVNKELFEKVQHSLEFYNVDFEVDQIEDDLLRYCRENNLDFIYSTLTSMPHLISLVYLDLQKPINYFEKLIILNRKLVGIIMKSRPFKRFKICTKPSNDKPYTVLHLYPITPKGFLPPLEELIDASKYPQHEYIRHNLLQFIIGQAPSSIINLELLPDNFALDICTLIYMGNEGLINAEEAALILLTVKYVEEDTVPEDIPTPEVIQPRAFILAFLFNECFMAVEKCLGVLGLTKWKKLNRFDGVLFHKLCKEYAEYAVYPSIVNNLLGDLAKYISRNDFRQVPFLDQLKNRDLEPEFLRGYSERE